MIVIDRFDDIVNLINIKNKQVMGFVNDRSILNGKDSDAVGGPWDIEDTFDTDDLLNIRGNYNNNNNTQTTLNFCGDWIDEEFENKHVWDSELINEINNDAASTWFFKCNILYNKFSISKPVHFKGVGTVVTKLLSWISTT